MTFSKILSWVILLALLYFGLVKQIRWVFWLLIAYGVFWVWIAFTNSGKTWAANITSPAAMP